MSKLDEFLKELGDAEITSQTFDEAKEEDDLSDAVLPVGDDDDADDEQEAPAPEPAPPTPPEQDDQITAQDYERIFAEQSRQQFNQIQQLMERQRPAQQEQPQFEDPMQRLHREVQELKQQQAASSERAKVAAEKLFRQDFDRTVSALKEQYPDINEFIPGERMEHAYREAVKAEAFGVDWKGEIGKTYKLLSHDKYFQARGKGEDEVSQKRAEKREKGKAISSGGATYQSPAKKLDKLSPTYDVDKKAAFLADLRQAGG